jgi:hypothetical protein
VKSKDIMSISPCLHKYPNTFEFAGHAAIMSNLDRVSFEEDNI